MEEEIACDPERLVTVLTCKGDVNDPCFPAQLNHLVCKLHRLVHDGKNIREDLFEVTKVEPWNSVRVTFSISKAAARRLRSLANSGDNSLRELGILSVQLEGDQVITLTLTASQSHKPFGCNIKPIDDDGHQVDSTACGKASIKRTVDKSSDETPLCEDNLNQALDSSTSIASNSLIDTHSSSSIMVKVTSVDSSSLSTADLMKRETPLTSLQTPTAVTSVDASDKSTAPLVTVVACSLDNVHAVNRINGPSDISVKCDDDSLKSLAKADKISSCDTPVDEIELVPSKSSSSVVLTKKSYNDHDLSEELENGNAPDAILHADTQIDEDCPISGNNNNSNNVNNNINNSGMTSHTRINDVHDECTSAGEATTAHSENESGHSLPLTTTVTTLNSPPVNSDTKSITSTNIVDSEEDGDNVRGASNSSDVAMSSRPSVQSISSLYTSQVPSSSVKKCTTTSPSVDERLVGDLEFINHVDHGESSSRSCRRPEITPTSSVEDEKVSCLSELSSSSEKPASEVSPSIPDDESIHIDTVNCSVMLTPASASSSSSVTNDRPHDQLTECNTNNANAEKSTGSSASSSSSLSSASSSSSSPPSLTNDSSISNQDVTPCHSNRRKQKLPQRQPSVTSLKQQPHHQQQHQQQQQQRQQQQKQQQSCETINTSSNSVFSHLLTLPDVENDEDTVRRASKRRTHSSNVISFNAIENTRPLDTPGGINGHSSDSNASGEYSPACKRMKNDGDSLSFDSVERRRKRDSGHLNQLMHRKIVVETSVAAAVNGSSSKDSISSGEDSSFIFAHSRRNLSALEEDDESNVAASITPTSGAATMSSTPSPVQAVNEMSAVPTNMGDDSLEPNASEDFNDDEDSIIPDVVMCLTGNSSSCPSVKTINNMYPTVNSNHVNSHHMDESFEEEAAVISRSTTHETNSSSSSSRPITIDLDESLEGVHSVASGDHNYISVKGELISESDVSSPVILLDSNSCISAVDQGQSVSSTNHLIVNTSLVNNSVNSISCNEATFDEDKLHRNLTSPPLVPSSQCLLNITDHLSRPIANSCSNNIEEDDDGFQKESASIISTSLKRSYPSPQVSCMDTDASQFNSHSVARNTEPAPAATMTTGDALAPQAVPSAHALRNTGITSSSSSNKNNSDLKSQRPNKRTPKGNSSTSALGASSHISPCPTAISGDNTSTINSTSTVINSSSKRRATSKAKQRKVLMP